MEKIIDLHVHTNKSDGAYTPLEIIDKAKQNNVSVLAIADHDTTEAYDESLFSYARKNNIELINAVEISTKIDNCGIHVLGYNIDLNNKKLQEKLYELRNARHIYLAEVAAKLEKLGYIINKEKLDAVDAVTKAHIASDIVENPINEELLIKTFGHVPNKGEFIETIMNEGCIAYVEKKSITPIEAALLIKEASGKVSLAHPVAYKYEDSLTEEDILKLIKDMEIDTIEANYIYVDKNLKKIDEVNEWREFALKNNLKCTIGSDFHNEDGIRPVIGLINDLKLDNNEIEEILNNIEE